jgi:hypothetical protein
MLRLFSPKTKSQGSIDKKRTIWYSVYMTNENQHPASETPLSDEDILRGRHKVDDVSHQDHLAEEDELIKRHQSESGRQSTFAQAEEDVQAAHSEGRTMEEFPDDPPTDPQE